MTVVLRLQGLDVKAGPGDIRTFFERLHIPDGGVYIVGGSLREAFIAFTTEKDGQLAMRRTGHFLKGSKITLHISTMEELEHKLKSKLKKKPSTMQQTVKKPQPPADAKPPIPPSDTQLLDANTAFLLGVCTVLQGLKSCQQRENNEPASDLDFSKADRTVVRSDKNRTHKQAEKSGPGFVRLFGLPVSVTKDEICHLFKGLAVQEAIVNVNLGLGHGCLVKFANCQDASNALSFNLQPLGSVCVEVRGATEKMWTSALQERENACAPDNVKSQQVPFEEIANHKQKSTSSSLTKRQSSDRLSSKSRKKRRLDSASTTALSAAIEYIVLVKNLPPVFTKTEIKELFGCPNIARNQVLHVLDKERNRTDQAFVIFDNAADYDYAMNLTGCHVGSNTIQVSSVTKDKMKAMLANVHPRPKEMRKSNSMKKPQGALNINLGPVAQTCMFVRNMPACVQKSQIQEFFSKYIVKKDNIVLLHDSDGNGIGEALIKFKSQKLAALAHRHHGQTFLGAKLLLTLITNKQMEELSQRNV
ncbi:hypothetical protein LDENG_00147290 [Lucifuga dentata]|nr:hypothetical protein LDENG_00147290 [Lucifuga dentata]